MLKAKVTEDFIESLFYKLLLFSFFITSVLPSENVLLSLCPIMAQNIALHFEISSNIEINRFLYSGFPVILITALEFNNKITFT